MVATLWSFPAWFISPDDKPSNTVFNNYLNQAQSGIFHIECQTIEAPTLSELVIQVGGIAWNTLISYNYLEWQGHYYIIQDVNYVSANNNVVQIHAQIDLYLSFLVQWFDETNNTYTTPVYFNQKHLNRFVYLSVATGDYSINPSRQFYLLNLHEQLGNIGSKKQKQVYTVNNFNYVPAQNGSTQFPNSNYFNVNDSIDSQGAIMPQAYPVILWQMTANSTTVANGSIEGNPAVYPFPYGLGSIGLNTDVVGGVSGYTCNAFQWNFLLDKNVDLGNEYYTDVYLFPISLNYLQNIQLESNTFGNLTTVFNFTGWDYQQSPSTTLAKGYNSKNDPVLTLSPTNNMYAVVQGIDSGTTSPDSLLSLTDEPALINYANFNARMYGQDNHIDLSSFILYNNAGVIQYLNGLMMYLGSFCITVSPPNMMLSNIPYATWEKLSTSGTNWCGVWNYNDYNDAIYSCQLKATAPSASTNWADYMAENKKSYDMSLNVSQLLAQNAQANIKVAQAKYGGSIASYDNVASDLISIISGSFGNKVASTYADSIGANVLAPNDAAIQQDKLNYLKTGMKADYTRTSNMRTSAISTINTLYDSTFCLVLEYPPLYEQVTAINYYALFGYKLERWAPFKYWLNRKYCNYVRITNFTNAFMPNYNAYYRGAIDSLLNKGIRIWNNVSFNGDYTKVPYNSVLINSNSTYTNVELNANNDELDYLTNEEASN